MQITLASYCVPPLVELYSHLKEKEREREITSFSSYGTGILEITLGMKYKNNHNMSDLVSNQLILVASKGIAGIADTG